ncbi:MAG: radical SAM protein [Candidatus Omnitrophica bacterium]|nr:radical SAM protein [Candidatus Omnitrophota bacterium]
MERMENIIKNYLSNIQFVPFKPRLLARIAENYWRIIILRKPCLRVVTLALTYTCQLSCNYCSAEELKRKDAEDITLSIGEIEKLLGEAEKCGAINIHFTGGEPLLYKNLYAIASLVDTDKNILSLVTNGLLLTQESKRLKNSAFDLVIVSIESPYSEIHDRIVGRKGAWRQAWDGIEVAKRVGLKVMVATVATQENISNGEIEQLIRLCKKNGLVLQILPVRSLGGWRHKDNVLLAPEAQKKFYRLVSDRNVRWDGQSSYLSPRCLAARERLYVDPEGNVLPCDFIQVPFGNIKNESLMDIWHRMLNTHPFDRKNSMCLSAFDEEFVKKVKDAGSISLS